MTHDDEHLELHAALHDFAVRMARGEVRHPVQEARRILGIPLVTDMTGTAAARRSVDRLFAEYGDELRTLATEGPTDGGEQ